MQKFVKIVIDIIDETHCSKECEYNDDDTWCQLFGEELNDERCENCINSEIQEIEEEKCIKS